MADIDVHITPDSTLMLSAAIRLRSGAEASPGVTLVLGGAGIAFDSVIGAPGSQLVLSGERDTAHLRFPNPVRRAGEIVVRAWWRAPARVGRNVAVGRQGALASWGGLWYPVPAWPAGGQASLLVPGTTRITVPAEWRTLSNGRLVDSAVAQGVRTETWRSPQPVARSFIAGPYAVAWHRVGQARVGVYLLPRHAGRSVEYAAAIPRFVRILAERFGPYPFESFAIAELPGSLAPPGFGGRSEQGYFIAHTDALDGPGVNVPLFAHELAHMWFPNLVDSRPPGDDMMDEALASYSVALVREETDGDSAATAELVDGNPDFSERGYFQYVRLGADEPLMADYSPFIARAKGPMVYRMLRGRVGDRVFFGTLQGFIRRYAHRSASLADLRQAFLLAAPGDTGLSDFFAQWLDRPGAPVLDLTWALRVGGQPGITVRIAQRGARFRMPLELAVDGSSGSVIHTVQISDSVHTFEFASPGTPSGVRMDPGHRLLLWRPEFGPPAGGAGDWPLDRWRAWLDDQTRWLMERYGVESVALAVADSGRIAWGREHGTPGAAVLERALLDSINASGRRDTLIQRTTAGSDSVSLFAGIPAVGQGSLIVARGGWGGRQLVQHLAQEIALRYGWRRVPR